VAGPGGIFESIFWLSNYKKVPRERGTRSNAGLGAQDILFSFSSFDLSRFVCLADMSSCYDFVMIIPFNLSADRWLDVSFVLDGFWEYES